MKHTLLFTAIISCSLVASAAFASNHYSMSNMPSKAASGYDNAMDHATSQYGRTMDQYHNTMQSQQDKMSRMSDQYANNMNQQQDNMRQMSDQF